MSLLFLFSGAKRCDIRWILDFLLTSAVSLPACWNVGLSVCSYLPQLGVWSLLKGHSIGHARRCLSVFITSCQVRTIKMSFILQLHGVFKCAMVML